MTERPVASPCVSICALDDDDICTGCHRSAAEITQWVKLNNEQRRAVLRACHQRACAAGLVMPVTPIPLSKSAQ